MVIKPILAEVQSLSFGLAVTTPSSPWKQTKEEVFKELSCPLLPVPVPDNLLAVPGSELGVRESRLQPKKLNKITIFTPFNKTR